MIDPKGLIGKLMYLPGGVKVRVEHIYDEDDPPKARTRRVGGPHDGIQAFIEVWKLEPCEETDEPDTLNLPSLTQPSIFSEDKVCVCTHC